MSTLPATDKGALTTPAKDMANMHKRTRTNKQGKAMCSAATPLYLPLMQPLFDTVSLSPYFHIKPAIYVAKER